MKSFFVLTLIVSCFVIGCAVKAPDPVPIEISYRKVDYLADVKPLLDKRCVVCHSCYNSPCQLKLSSYEGLDRGASKKKIYNATRLKTMDPTRLFVDAGQRLDFDLTVFGKVNKGSAAQVLHHLDMVPFANGHQVHRPGDHYRHGSAQAQGDFVTDNLGRFHLKQALDQGLVTRHEAG